MLVCFAVVHSCCYTTVSCNNSDPATSRFIICDEAESTDICHDCEIGIEVAALYIKDVEDDTVTL